MRKLTLLLALSCFCSICSPVRAASLFNGFALPGFVSPAIGMTPVPVSRIPTPWFIGQPIGDQFVFDVTDLGTTGFGALSTTVPSSGFIVPATPGALVSLSNTGTILTGIDASLPPLTGNNFSGSVGTVGFARAQGGQSSDILAVAKPPIIFLSAGSADDPPVSNLTLRPTISSYPVSSVPLPPALPLFGLALAALGIAGFRQRKLAKSGISAIARRISATTLPAEIPSQTVFIRDNRNR